MVTREDVVYAYRLLLGREPESDLVVERVCAGSPDLGSLRRQFLASDEFRTGPAVEAGVVGKLSAPVIRHSSPVDRPMAVDVEVSPDKLAQLFAKTAAQWSHLGATEPHWSVLTDEKFRQRNLPSNRDEFYASGASDLEWLHCALARAGVTPGRVERLLELGCGVGRVTVHLAKHVGEVLALDISAAHLRLAEEQARAVGVGNVRFVHLQSIDDLARLGAIDFLYSRIVLQHNPPPVIARLLGDMLGMLRPGGLGYFQVPTYAVGYRFRIDDYLAGRNLTNIEMHVLPQRELFALVEAKGCRVLELREDDATGREGIRISNTLLVQKRL